MVGLVQPKWRQNVGGVLRAAHCFGASGVALTGCRYKRHGADTTAAYKYIPLFQVDDLHAIVPYACVPVAVEYVEDGTAQNLATYTHPKSAMYIFGPEDGTLGCDVRSWCRDTIYIPTAFCLNLAATVNVVLYDRMVKHEKKYSNPTSGLTHMAGDILRAVRREHSENLQSNYDMYWNPALRASVDGAPTV